MCLTAAFTARTTPAHAAATTPRAASTAMRMTHQTAHVAHASSLAVGACQKAHLLHLDSSAAVQWLMFVKWTHPN